MNKTKLLEIAQALDLGTIDDDKARNLLLGLLGVSGSLTMRVEQMEFIPEEPFLSDVISWEKGNIWELHELFTDSQNIEVRVNKNYR
jgi:hypothetical protein